MEQKLPPPTPYTEVEDLAIGDELLRLAPGGLRVYARAFAAAAAKLPEPQPFGPVRHYLSCHAIELALEAYLSLHGASLVKLSE